MTDYYTPGIVCLFQFSNSQKQTTKCPGINTKILHKREANTEPKLRAGMSVCHSLCQGVTRVAEMLSHAFSSLITTQDVSVSADMYILCLDHIWLAC